jgi:hypothetical protein
MAQSAVAGAGQPARESWMPDWELLNTDRHSDLAIRPATARGRHFIQLVPSEMMRVATRCPVMLTKRADTGAFFVGALCGFVEGENLLLGEDGSFEVPLPFAVERDGFAIADENIAVDRSHPRFANDGKRLFDNNGEATDTLQRVQRALASLHAGEAASKRFIGTLLDLKLVELIDVTLSFDDGERINLEGLYTISRDALGDLSDRDALSLFRSGDLLLAHVMIASLQHVPVLARRRNERLLG